MAAGRREDGPTTALTVVTRRSRLEHHSRDDQSVCRGDSRTDPRWLQRVRQVPRRRGITLPPLHHGDELQRSKLDPTGSLIARVERREHSAHVIDRPAAVSVDAQEADLVVGLGHQSSPILCERGRHGRRRLDVRWGGRTDVAACNPRRSWASGIAVGFHRSCPACPT